MRNNNNNKYVELKRKVKAQNREIEILKLALTAKCANFTDYQIALDIAAEMYHKQIVDNTLNKTKTSSQQNY